MLDTYAGMQQLAGYMLVVAVIGFIYLMIGGKK